MVLCEGSTERNGTGARARELPVRGGSPASNAEVAVIATTYNEEDSLPRLIASIENQTVRPKEVVVVDAGSTDRTVEILREWSRSSTITVHTIVEERAGISRGRNCAIAAANCEVVAVTDAGAIARPNWIELLLASLEDDVDVVSGFFEPIDTNDFRGTLARIITPHIEEIKPRHFLPSSRSVLLRKTAWRAAGGYPEWLDYCEDLVFDLNLKKSGAKFVFQGEAIVEWDARPTISAYARQYYRYARGDGKAGLFRRRHLARYGAYGTATIVLSAKTGRRAWILAVLGLGSMAYTYKYVRRVWWRRTTLNKWSLAKTFAFLPGILAIGDVAKMIGYPVGMVHKRKIANHGAQRDEGGQVRAASEVSAATGNIARSQHEEE